jgi:5-methyltetrahydrofolate--homocysteine methyltransferase
MSLNFKRTLILDGAMGTMLQNRGLLDAPEFYCVTHPGVITDIHAGYIEAGAQMIYANTFGANRLKLKDSGYGVAEIVSAAITCAKNAAKGKAEILVGLDIGPAGELLAPKEAVCPSATPTIFLKK